MAREPFSTLFSSSPHLGAWCISGCSSRLAFQLEGIDFPCGLEVAGCIRADFCEKFDFEYVSGSLWGLGGVPEILCY